MIMSYRENEAIVEGLKEAFSLLTGPTLESSIRHQSEARLAEIIKDYGPVVSSYPSWHPLVDRETDQYFPETTPNEQCGYKGLDHTVFLRKAIITCPYEEAEVLASVKKLKCKPVASITAEKLDFPLYHTDATPIIIKCEWDHRMATDGTIPKALAIALLLEKELPCWQWAKSAESWETMRPYFLGRPCGSRSSLFVNQETAQAMKRVWHSLIDAGIFGPLRSD